MDFEWDETKSERNRIARGLSFGVARFLFANTVVEEVDERRDYGELRVRATGVIAGRVVVCIYTDRGNIRRVISLRDAKKGERDGYRAAIERRI